jgi:hypothetical protein
LSELIAFGEGMWREKIYSSQARICTKSQMTLPPYKVGCMGSEEKKKSARAAPWALSEKNRWSI